MTTPQHEAGASLPSTSISRRNLVAGAAWTAPVMIAVSAAPAIAATGSTGHCPAPSTIDFGAALTGGWRTSTAAGVTMTFVSQTFHRTATKKVTYTPPSDNRSVVKSLSTARIGNLASFDGMTFLKMRQILADSNSSASKRAKYSEFTISFSKPVFGLSFYMTDIDYTANQFTDSLCLTAPTTMTGSIVGTGSNVTGLGTVRSPFLGSKANSPDTGSDAGKSVAMYAAPTTTGISSLTFRYRNTQTAGGNQAVFISPMTFYPASCTP